ncbi:MAG: GNAT family N-acetyltransferase [Chloroflexi bacterium]|nr:GNAT family N-acetyltransferase [Chloroflexota bacterium]
MSIEIEYFRPDRLSALVRLLDDSFQIANPDKAELVRWKFFAPIHRGGTVMAVALDDNRVVSQYANTPLVLSDGGRPLSAMVCADMATAPQYRGRGLISQLARDVYARVVHSGAVLSIGYSNDAGVKVDMNARGYGYRVVGRFARYVSPVLRARTTPIRLEPAAEFNDGHLPVPSASSLSICKSADYLTWRYLRKPNADYRIFRIAHGPHSLGYAILRDSGQRAHLVDLIAEPTPDLIRAVQNTVRASGKRVLVVYVLDNPFWHQTLRGFVRIPRQARLENYYLTVKPHTSSMPAGWDTPDRWRLMGGDII